MKLPAVLFALFVAGLIALVLALCWPSGNMTSRDIGCAKVHSGRGSDICNALSASMEWTWMGHSIVSPGWRMTWAGLSRVYCREKITAADLAILEALKRASDWRLRDGADDLIRLVSSSRGNGNEPENSIFNPNHPDYILKNGCEGLA
jgi:hypothetical protein